jgi:hypothetical protein
MLYDLSLVHAFASFWGMLIAHNYCLPKQTAKQKPEFRNKSQIGTYPALRILLPRSFRLNNRMDTTKPPDRRVLRSGGLRIFIPGSGVAAY